MANFAWTLKAHLQLKILSIGGGVTLDSQWKPWIWIGSDRLQPVSTRNHPRFCFEMVACFKSVGWFQPNCLLGKLDTVGWKSPFPSIKKCLWNPSTGMYDYRKYPEYADLHARTPWVKTLTVQHHGMPTRYAISVMMKLLLAVVGCRKVENLPILLRQKKSRSLLTGWAAPLLICIGTTSQAPEIRRKLIKNSPRISRAYQSWVPGFRGSGEKLFLHLPSPKICGKILLSILSSSTISLQGFRLRSTPSSTKLPWATYFFLAINSKRRAKSVRFNVACWALQNLHLLMHPSSCSSQDQRKKCKPPASSSQCYEDFSPSFHLILSLIASKCMLIFHTNL